MIEPEPKTLAGKRNRAIMAVTWFGMFRGSEVCVLDMRFFRRRVKRRKYIEEVLGYEVTLLQSKANKPVNPRYPWTLCALRPRGLSCAELDASLATSKVSSGPVFRCVFPTKAGGRAGAGALSATVLADIVKRAAERVSIAPQTNSGHTHCALTQRRN